MTKYAYTLIVDCTAPDDLFLEDYPKGVSKKTQQIVEDQQPYGIPCEGTQTISSDCNRCPWCASLEWVDFEEA